MTTAPATQVRASFNRRARSRSGDLMCQIGRDLKLSTARLEAFCFREIDEFDKEFVYLAGVVAFADRSINRHLTKTWCRHIHIVMPVGNPQAWSKPAIIAALQDALGYLSGDAWSFEFTQRTEKLPRLEQPDLDLSASNSVVVPFSAGLDSFAQSKLLRSDGYDDTPIRITAKNHAVSGERDWCGDGTGKKSPRVSIPFTIKTSTHAEQTYRTRTFVFAAMAGLAAHLAKSRCIVVPEAGQGSFGPSLVPVGIESPHRGSHPGFTRRMSALFRALWNENIPFVHPQVWRTKGQVLRRLSDLNLHDGWASTHSCSQGPRQIRTERRKTLQCGFCSGCLLRRVSVFAAGLEEPANQYFWADLKADSLRNMICADARRGPSKNDHDIAVHAVMAMEGLARLADRPQDDLMFQRNLFDAFEPSELDDAATKLRALVTAHRDEWRSFTSALPASAWINQQIALL